MSRGLREALYAIAGFSGLLCDWCYETIDADGRRCIDRVLAGTRTTSNLVDDLPEPGRDTRAENLAAAGRPAGVRVRDSGPAGPWLAHRATARQLYPGGRGRGSRDDFMEFAKGQQ
jgi:hypothetical protein